MLCQPQHPWLAAVCSSGFWSPLCSKRGGVQEEVVMEQEIADEVDALWDAEGHLLFLFFSNHTRAHPREIEKTAETTPGK